MSEQTPPLSPSAPATGYQAGGYSLLVDGRYYAGESEETEASPAPGLTPGFHGARITGNRERNKLLWSDDPQHFCRGITNIMGDIRRVFDRAYPEVIILRRVGAHAKAGRDDLERAYESAQETIRHLKWRVDALEGELSTMRQTCPCGGGFRFSTTYAGGGVIDSRRKCLKCGAIQAEKSGRWVAVETKRSPIFKVNKWETKQLED